MKTCGYIAGTSFDFRIPVTATFAGDAVLENNIYSGGRTSLKSSGHLIKYFLD